MGDRDYLAMAKSPTRLSAFDDGVHNARIEYATLDLEDRGVLIGTVGFAIGGGGQAMGGYCLEGRDGPSKFCEAFIIGILWATGAGEWGKLKGTPCRILKEDSWIVAVGHLLEDRWFRPSEVAEAVKEKETP